MAWNEPGNSGRDPWNPPPGGGKRDGEGGGPDLQSLLRRLRLFFGIKGGSGGGQRPSQQQMAGLGAVLLAIGWLLSGFYSVDEQERAVVLRFGAYAGTAGQGVRWHLPWPIEHVEKIRVTNVRAVSSRATLLTADENIVEAEITAQFRVASPEQFAFNVDDPDKTLQQSLASVLRETVGHSTMDEVLRGARQTIGLQIRQKLQERLDSYSAGLLVTDVNLQQVEPPEAVQAAFAEAIKAREDKARDIASAEAYAKDRLPRAQAEAERQLAEAGAYRDQAIARAEGDTARFVALLEQYRKSPQVTRDRLYIDAMSEVLARTGKVIVDVDHGNPSFAIPIEKLIQARERSSDTTDTAASAPAPATAPAAPPPSRPAPSTQPPAVVPSPGDGYRSRERGSH